MKKTCGALAISLMIATTSCTHKPVEETPLQKCIWFASLGGVKHPKLIDFKCRNRQLNSDGKVLTIDESVKINVISSCITRHIDFWNKSKEVIEDKNVDAFIKSCENDYERMERNTYNYPRSYSTDSYESKPTQEPSYADKMRREREIESIREDERIIEHYRSQNLRRFGK